MSLEKVTIGRKFGGVCLRRMGIGIEVWWGSIRGVWKLGGFVSVIGGLRKG